MRNDNLFDGLPVIGQILMCSLMVLLVPLWFPFWILDELKKQRREKQMTYKKKESKNAM